MAIRDLLRRANQTTHPVHSSCEPKPAFSIDPVTLLPVVRADARKITMEAIQTAIDDEDHRHLELLGMSSEDIHPAPSR